jgi:hypothetical protein
MKQNRITNALWIVPLLAIFLGSSACASKATPPGANIIFASLITSEGSGGSYTLLQWKEGLSISIIDDSQGPHESPGSGSTEDPVWRGQGSIRSESGQNITWHVETTDGKKAKFFINEQSYDLAQGTLFLIKTNNGSPQIMQHQNRYNGGCSDDESCQQLLKQDPAVLQFIQETLQLPGSPSQNESPAGLTTPLPTASGEAPAPAGWLTHTSQQCEYAISYPAEMQVTDQNRYSQIFGFKLANPEEGARNFIYVSMITPEIQNRVKQGINNGDVYNYDPVHTEILLNMQVGESKPVHMSPKMETWFTYERKPDTQISDHTAQTYENLQPWEFPAGTKEIRYYWSLNGCSYLIGGYLDTTESNQPGAITEYLFHQIVATIQLMP